MRRAEHGRALAWIAVSAALIAAPLASAQQAPPGGEVEDFIGRGLETSILLGAGPGPGDAKFDLGETEVRNTKLLVDAELPLGPLVDPGPGPGAGQVIQGEGGGSAPAERPREAAAEGEPVKPPPKRYLLQPLLDLRVGLCTTERRASETVPGVPFVRIQTDTQTYAAGFGLRIELLERWLHLEPRLTFVYGDTKSAAEGGDPLVRQQFERDQHEVLVDWHVQTLTLLPIISLELDPQLGPIGVHAALTATQLRTFTLSSSTPRQRTQRSSVTLRASLALDLPIPGFAPGGQQVYLMPAVGYTRLEGDLGRLPDTGRNFFDFSLGIAPDLKGVLPLVGRLGFSVTYVRGHNLEGFGWDVIWIVAV